MMGAEQDDKPLLVCVKPDLDKTKSHVKEHNWRFLGEKNTITAENLEWRTQKK